MSAPGRDPVRIRARNATPESSVQLEQHHTIARRELSRGRRKPQRDTGSVSRTLDGAVPPGEDLVDRLVGDDQLVRDRWIYAAQRLANRSVRFGEAELNP